MEEILEYIERLEKDSFECWTKEAMNGYLTACGSIRHKIEEALKKEMSKT